MKQSMAKMQNEIDKALARADAAYAALKQPPDLKVVYDAAYQHMVSKPAAVFRELIPMILSGLPAIENLAVFLDEHRNVIEYRGGMPVTNDANVRSRLGSSIASNRKRFGDIRGRQA